MQSSSLHPSSASPPKSSAVRPHCLQVGAGGAVVDDDALSEQVEKRRHGDLLTGDETGLVAIASRGLSPYPSGRLTSSRQVTTGSAAPVR